MTTPTAIAETTSAPVRPEDSTPDTTAQLNIALAQADLYRRLLHSTTEEAAALMANQKGMLQHIASLEAQVAALTPAEPAGAAA